MPSLQLKRTRNEKIWQANAERLKEKHSHFSSKERGARLYIYIYVYIICKFIHELLVPCLYHSPCLSIFVAQLLQQVYRIGLPLWSPCSGQRLPENGTEWICDASKLEALAN